MVPSETPNPVGSGDNVPLQPPFPPSPLTQFSNNMTMSMPNISSLLNNNHSFVNGGSGESDIGFSGLSSSGQHFPNVSANQQQRSTKMEPQNFQQQRGGGLAGVKLEPGGQVSNDQQQQQKMLRSLGSVKLEPQQLQAMRNLSQVKMEPQLSEQSLFLQQQQQRQFLQMPPGQSPQNQMNIYQQQRLMQLQHQQHLLKSMPQQRPQLPQHQRPPLKPVYEPGMGAQRLTQYMYRQQHRPEVKLLLTLK